jgi:hypothetical protein
VTQGELEAQVTAMGADSFFGKTIALLGAPDERGHLQKVSPKVRFSNQRRGLKRALKPENPQIIKPWLAGALFAPGHSARDGPCTKLGSEVGFLGVEPI